MDVKELAERLKELSDAYVASSEFKAEYCAFELANHVANNLDTILRCLETVAGIERLAGNVLYQDVVIAKLKDFWVEVNPAFNNTKIEVAREDLHSAVSAAVEASEKGGV